MLDNLISLLLATASICIGKPHPHSNIDLIAALRNHNYGTDGNSSIEDEAYDSCISGKLETTSKDRIFGPNYRFGIEFTPISLSCSPCHYSSNPSVTWKKLSFENQETELQNSDGFEIGKDDSLIIKEPKPEDFGTYYCIIQGFVGYIWTLEIEPFQYFDIFKARHWSGQKGSNPIDLTTMKIYTKLEPWSQCNKCDRVGKRHRIGYCLVEALESESSEHKALQVYKNGLSCNLFLLIHPESDPDTIEALERKPVLLIGYCRTLCDYFESAPEVLYAKVHPKIHQVYQNEMEMRADIELEKLREKNKGKRDLIPGKPTFFEGLTLVFLLSLQAYIIIHVYRNRRKAN